MELLPAETGQAEEEQARSDLDGVSLSLLISKRDAEQAMGCESEAQSSVQARDINLRAFDEHMKCSWLESLREGTRAQIIRKN